MEILLNVLSTLAFASAYILINAGGGFHEREKSQVRERFFAYGNWANEAVKNSVSMGKNLF